MCNFHALMKTPMYRPYKLAWSFAARLFVKATFLQVWHIGRMILVFEDIKVLGLTKLAGILSVLRCSSIL